MTYQEFQTRVAGTCTHTVNLIDGKGNIRLGIYNGLAHWGEVWGFKNGFDAYGGLFKVEQLSTDWVEDESDEEGGYLPHFTPADFEASGYALA